ncbi:hypothetical protein [Flavobacterium sp. NRK1]|uniref:hypothetical protein n=1 Tax=Flavobacterium sp. NRK1 TaxID=2954929 RepID=UPI002093AB9F|nr:hypothetical protein [Flavobacterium sp. NRK1]MCO6147496.1 hypothetical protein [Flavobacterium sp. NRK1]
MENDGLIKITDRADISFQNDNFQVDFKWDDIHVKAIMTQKGIDKIRNYKNVGFEKTMSIINVIVALIALILTLYTIYMDSKVNDLEKRVENLESHQLHPSMR